MQTAGIAVAGIHETVRAHGAAGKELRIQRGAVEAADRARNQTERARRERSPCMGAVIVDSMFYGTSEGLSRAFASTLLTKTPRIG